jgi:hypothetical protein
MIPNLIDLVTVALFSSLLTGIIVYSYLWGRTRKTFRILGATQSLLDLVYEKYGEDREVLSRIEMIRKSIKDLILVRLND